MVPPSSSKLLEPSQAGGVRRSTRVTVAPEFQASSTDLGRQPLRRHGPGAGGRPPARARRGGRPGPVGQWARRRRPGPISQAQCRNGRPTGQGVARRRRPGPSARAARASRPGTAPQRTASRPGRRCPGAAACSPQFHTVSLLIVPVRREHFLDRLIVSRHATNTNQVCW